MCHCFRHAECCGIWAQDVGEYCEICREVGQETECGPHQQASVSMQLN